MAEHRNWAGLPCDVISLIFLKLGVIEVLLRTQAVCRSWWHVAHEPQIWRCIDLLYEPAAILKYAQRVKLARQAVDRCGGYLEKICADDLNSDEILSYVADRTTGLRCLVLIETSFFPFTGMLPGRYPISRCVTVEGLSAFVGRFELLEELQITICHPFREQTFEGVIQMLCGKLKLLLLNKIWCKFTCGLSQFDIEALEIANNLPQLLELQLIGNKITNKGLHAILDKCLYLESLDIRACLNVNVDAGLQAKLSKLKMVRLPCDSTADYEFQTVTDDNDYWSDGDYLAYMGDFHSLDIADNSD